MSAFTFDDLRGWAKRGEGPAARLARWGWRRLRGFEVPMVAPLHGPLYRVHRLVAGGLSGVLRLLYWTPLFQSRLAAPAPRLHLYGGMPWVSGPLELAIGADCRISGHTTLSGRAAATGRPRLTVGDNVDIGWQTTIAVGRRVEIGDNVRIAGRGFLAGYPGHPLAAEARARGLPEREEQVGDIVLERDVWLATGVYVMAGVRIGRGTVVAAGSVVTRDLPPGVLAAGVPARVVRRLEG